MGYISTLATELGLAPAEPDYKAGLRTLIKAMVDLHKEAAASGHDHCTRHDCEAAQAIYDAKQLLKTNATVAGRQA